MSGHDPPPQLMYFWSLNPNLCLVFTRNPSFCLKTTFYTSEIQNKTQRKIENFTITIWQVFSLLFFSIANDFTQLKAEKFVKLKIDENVNFDFRILRDEKLHFLAKGGISGKN